MLPDSFSLRRAAVAYLFPSQPELRREESLSFYDRVSAHGLDVPQFSQQRNALKLLRSASGARANVFEIQVGIFQDKFRFLVAETWPSVPLKIIAENADIAWDCFNEIWPRSRLGPPPALVEVSFRMSAAAEGGNATTYLQDRVLRVSHQALEKLGRQVQGFGLRLVLPVQLAPEEQQLPLAGASSTIRIESLLEDASQLYFEVTAKWPTIPLPAELRKIAGAPDVINPKVFKPSHYVTATYQYVTERIAAFLTQAAKG